MADYPVASGITSMSGTYIPEVWAGKMVVKFYLSTVFAAISNTDYQGEITKYGDKVHIRVIPDITISDYIIGQGLNYERPTTSDVELDIDKGHYYAFAVNKVEQVQSDLAYVEKWTDDAGQQMAKTIDSGILSNVYSEADSNNSGATAGADSGNIDLGVTGTPAAVDKTNILDFLVDMGTVLDEQNVPDTARWQIMPPIFCGMVKKSDLKDASLAGDGTSILRNGRIGAIDRFTIYRSNNIAKNGTTPEEWNMIFGHPSCLTFASQIVEHETLKNQDDFGDLIRGLQVYGYKVVNGKGIGHFVAKKG
ncbi:MAG: hypothetical protein IMF18_11120 [Proteobacteria bacterium]|nr:hypothetical protein [Pseudomonadota bacterium]